MLHRLLWLSRLIWILLHWLLWLSLYRLLTNGLRLTTKGLAHLLKLLAALRAKRYTVLYLFATIWAELRHKIISITSKIYWIS